MIIAEIEFQQLGPTATTLIAAFVGGGAAALISAVASFIERRGEARRQFRDLAIRSALDAWRQQAELAVSLVNSGKRDEYKQPPPDDFICHMLRVMDEATNMQLTGAEAAKRISEKK